PNTTTPPLQLGRRSAGAGLASLVAAKLQRTGPAVGGLEAAPVPACTDLVLRVHARATDGRKRRGLRVSPADEPQRSALIELDQGEGEARLGVPTLRRGWQPAPRLKLSTTRPLGLARAW